MENRKKIVYCIPHLYNAGGMERVLTQKVNWLVRNTNYDLRIVTTELVPEGMSQTAFALDERVHVVELGIDFDADYSRSLPVKGWQHVRKMHQYKQLLSRYIREEGVDLCVSMGGKEVAFLSELPCATIVEVHFSKDHRRLLLEASHPGSEVWSRLGQIRTWQLVQAIQPLQRLVVLTEADKRDWEQSGCVRTVCIPNPCSLDGVSIPLRSAPSHTVLAVGRLHPQKGFDMLLQAWQTVVAHQPRWVLRIVGEGPMRGELEQMIAELQLQDSVVLAGQVEHMEQEYAEADLLVMSSRYEGLPLALIEGMWCGVPAVSFDCPHGPAELLANGRGIVVPNQNVQALAEKMEDLMKNEALRKEIGDQAKYYARTCFSEQAIMEQWVKLFEQCM